MRYVIDTQQTKEAGLLTIALFTDTLQPISFDTRTLSTIKDPILHVLYTEEALYSPSKQHYSFFHIRAGSVVKILQQLATTRQVYIDKKPAVIDLFSHISLSVDAIIERDEVLLETYATWYDNKLSLSSFDCCIRSRPQIAIKGAFIYLFDDTVTWNDLCFLQQPLTSKAAFIQWQQDTDLTYHVIEESLEPVQPHLQLQDTRGQFCTLITNNNQTQKELQEAGYQYKPEGSSSHFCSYDKVHNAILYLLNKGWRIEDSKGRAVQLLTHCNLSYSLENHGIEITGHIASDHSQGEVSDYLQALTRNEALIPLHNNTLGLITNTSHQEMAKEVEYISHTCVIKKHLLGLLDAPPCNLRSSLSLQNENPLFQGTLRPYQQEGVAWLHQLAKHGFGALLADEMGLGKTIQVIAFLTHLPKDALTLLIVPASLLDNWQRELTIFFPSCPTHRYHGAARTLTAQPFHGVIITTYGTLRQDIEILAQYRFSCCVLDESHIIKNETSDTAKAVYRLHTNCMISITGTPIENRPQELYGQFRALNPQLLSKQDISSLSCPHTFYQVQKKIQPFILRRTKQQVAQDLPPIIEQTTYVNMYDEEALQYTQIAASLKKGLVTKISASTLQAHRMEILEAILRLRQLACHPRLVEQLATHNSFSSAKHDQVISDIEMLVTEGKKILIFSQFAEMLYILKNTLQEKKQPFLHIDGSTTNRQEIIDKFQQQDIPILLMTMKTGGVGLNLTAADAILLYDPWWNEAQEAQAIARAHRIGREKSILVKRYIVQHSIEEQVQQLKTHKTTLEHAFLYGL